MPFDASLLDEAVPSEVPDIGFHLSLVTLISESRKVVCWNYTEFAYIRAVVDLPLAFIAGA